MKKIITFAKEIETFTQCNETFRHKKKAKVSKKTDKDKWLWITRQNKISERL